jgi:hypothetical protein
MPGQNQSLTPSRRVIPRDVASPDMPLREVRLTEPQQRLLAHVIEHGEVHFDGRQLPAADTLTDWGLVTQHQPRTGHTFLRPFLRPTARGRRWRKP